MVLLIIVYLGYPSGNLSASNNGGGSNSPRTGSPGEAGSGANAPAGGAPGQNPMAALMSVADILPPGSPRSSPPAQPNQAPRSASRGSQHSPNSSGKINKNSPVSFVVSN